MTTTPFTTKLLDDGNLEITIPVVLRSLQGRKRIVAPDTSTDACENILLALARGRRWQKFIDDNQFTNIRELADTIGKDPSQIARAIRLTRLSPTIIHRAIVGDLPPSVSLAKLRTNLPEKMGGTGESVDGVKIIDKMTIPDNLCHSAILIGISYKK